MKYILLISLFISAFSFAYIDEDNQGENNTEILNLESHLNTQNPEAETQLASSGNNYYYNNNYYKNNSYYQSENHYNYGGPVYNNNVRLSAICRRANLYCYTSVNLVGSLCSCYDAYTDSGFLGRITAY